MVQFYCILHIVLIIVNSCIFFIIVNSCIFRIELCLLNGPDDILTPGVFNMISSLSECLVAKWGVY